MELLQETEIDIKKLYESPEGTEESFEFELELPELAEDFVLNSVLQGKLRLMKEKEGIFVFLDELSLELGLQCDLCLEDANLKLSIRNKEREYFNKKINDKRLGGLDEENLFQIDLAKMTIDIAEFLREEILLAKPENVYCKKSCKGLCPECGQNLNLGTCECAESSKNAENPFQNLKDMLKEQ
ncbi:MAG: DUF177 domain-containing protein [Candidatus Gracilibacteria bacterium]|nr:DUF177 domain-containing protein [Candidatus Gracilibacteria bacterium]